METESDSGSRDARDVSASSTVGASLKTPLTDHARITVPLICGAMYPCSNPELIAAVSAAGGAAAGQELLSAGWARRAWSSCAWSGCQADSMSASFDDRMNPS